MQYLKPPKGTAWLGNSSAAVVQKGYKETSILLYQAALWKGADVEGVTKEWDRICEIRQWNEDFQ